MPKPSISEQEMGGLIIPWFENQGWDVYPEVAAYQGSPVADMVCKRGKIIWAVEMKKSLSLDVITQAFFWTRHANFSSICVPSMGIGSSRRNASAKEILRKLGIGAVILHGHNDISEIIRPEYRRRVDPRLFNVLNEGHKKMGVAGSCRGERWTPFKETVLNIKEYVRRNPGTTYKDLLGNITFHWKTSSTAKHCIKLYIDTGIIKGIRVDTSEKTHRLYLETMT